MKRMGARSLRIVLVSCFTASSLAAQPEQEPAPAGEQPPVSDAPVSEPAAAEVVELGAAEPEQAADVAPGPGGQLPPDTNSRGIEAYQKALEAKQLSASIPLSRARLQEELGRIEGKLVDGRHDEAIGDLVYIVESPRFGAFRESAEGRAARYLLGDALGLMGATQLARGYLVPLTAGDPNDTWTRRAIKSLVDLGLNSDEPQVFLKDLEAVSRSAPEEIRGDIAYLKGRIREREKQHAEALAEFAKVSERSRFWAQATYYSGLIEVERGNLKQGEQLFCKVADPKATPRHAPLFGGGDFFRVRDLARLGLGRIAHEQYRFDDAQYYYYLVPRDSPHLPEALYETATTRYESKDYEGAREYMDELRALEVDHSYQDEAWLLDAYIDLANCKFPQADAKLNEFLRRYEPVRNAARRLVKDELSMKKLVEAVRLGSDPAAAGTGARQSSARALGALLRVDSRYNRATLRLARLDHQMRGLLKAMGDLDEAQRRLAKPDELRPQSSGPLGQSDYEKVQRIEAQLSEVKRLIRELKRSGARAAELAELEKQAEALTVRVKAARAAMTAGAGQAGTEGKDLAGLIAEDRARASRLYESSGRVRAEVEREQLELARDALVRLDKRLSRLIRRARLGRIETVLGKKRALEVEIEALSQGLLPQTIVDSLDAERYLRDDEEYWPFEGEDWADEYVGGEGLQD